MLKLWILPLVAALFWIVLTASSLAELGTLTPSLRAAAAARNAPLARRIVRTEHAQGATTRR